MSFLRGETDEQGNPLPKKRNMGDPVSRKRKRSSTSKVMEKLKGIVDKLESSKVRALIKAATQRKFKSSESDLVMQKMHSILRKMTSSQVNEFVRIAKARLAKETAIIGSSQRSRKGTFYNVHIDREDGWDALVREKKAALEKLLKVDQIQSVIGIISNLNFVLKTALRHLAKKGTEAILWAQIERIAGILDVDALVIFALQLMYELNTMCTSVVLRTKEGTVAHGRTMDWDMKELEAISVPVRVYANNKPIGTSMHWVGCVGMFTVMRSQGYSISINYRVQRDDYNALKSAKTIVTNYFNNSLTNSMVMTLNGWLGFGDAGMYETIHAYVGDMGTILLSRWIQRSQAASFILRDVLLNCTTYEEALDQLKRTPVFTQVYFTIAGIDGGAVIARSHDRVDRMKALTSSTHYLIQPNMDWWGGTDVMNSRKRTTFMEKVLQSRDMKAMWDKMSNKKRNIVCGDITVYSTLMVPSQNKMEWTIGPGKR